jgi:hypothetical protein
LIILFPVHFILVEDSFKHFCAVWTLVSELMTVTATRSAKGFYIWHGLQDNKDAGVPWISCTVGQQGNGCAFDFIMALLHQWFRIDFVRLCQWPKSTVWTRFVCHGQGCGNAAAIFQLRNGHPAVTPKEALPANVCLLHEVTAQREDGGYPKAVATQSWETGAS